MAKFKGLFVAKPLEVVTATYPDLKASVKENLNIDSSDTSKDAQITRLVQAATEVAENFTGRVIAQKQLKYYAYNFSANEIYLPIAPWAQTVSVKAGATGNLQTISNVNTLQKTLGVYFDFETGITADELEIIVNAGYSSLPKPIEQAIIIIASDMFDTDRSNYIYNVSDNQTAKKLLSPYILTRY